MNSTLAIARREIDSYFSSPLGWICIIAFMVITGLYFGILVSFFSQESGGAGMYGDPPNLNEWVLPPFFDTSAILLMFICPALSMRLFSEDLRQRSFELLQAAPISSLEIVAGKFLGSVGFLVMLFLSTLHCVAILYWFGDPDPGVIATGYLALFLLASAFIAAGMLFSAMTSNQIVAFVLTFGLMIALWFVSWVGQLGGGGFTETLAYASVLSHIEGLTKGVVHTKDLVYFFTFIGFFLFATWQQVESYRWR